MLHTYAQLSSSSSGSSIIIIDIRLERLKLTNYGFLVLIGEHGWLQVLIILYKVLITLECAELDSTP